MRLSLLKAAVAVLDGAMSREFRHLAVIREASVLNRLRQGKWEPKRLRRRSSGIPHLAKNE
jgi:hypothetical protein